MRYILKFSVILIAAVAFSVITVVATTAAFDDALRDFLDAQTVKRVMGYWRATNGSRMGGMALLLVMWSGVVLAVDRVVDSAAAVIRRARPISN